ncbi:MAG: helix-turn-helix transcriptional regulator [Flavobacteriaceae bacterium]
MENIAFTNRLQKLLEYYDLSASSFASKIGVQRSSISHVLSGRNKPSLDFVMKLLHTFNDVSIEWLVDGKGTFPKSKTPPTPIETNNIQEDYLNVELKKELVDPTVTFERNSAKHSSGKEIEKIILLYTDGSFESFKN